MFHTAFIEGRENPEKRPTEVQWYNALNSYLNSGLTQCTEKEKHQYNKALRECPYCAADNRHHKAQSGFITATYREDNVKEQTSLEVILNSRRQTRKWHIIVSLILWVSTAVIYFGVNLAMGNRTFGLNPAYWSGYEFLFVGAAIIECLIEIFFSRKELVVLRDNINLRELDPKNYDIDLRKYERRLRLKIIVMSVVALVLAVVFGVLLMGFAG